jgi:23S rRNA (pseudouridine1915-N3)-methyltransferase
MQIRLISVGERVPAWVRSGYLEYANRLPRECQLALREIAPARRGKTTSVSQWREEEGTRMLAAVSQGSRVVALDVKGKLWTTQDLAEALQHWMTSGGRVSLLIGGPDGLWPPCLTRADDIWSLSPLTFPHALVRVIVAEQIYRAWSLLHHHPYHRC